MVGGVQHQQWWMLPLEKQVGLTIATCVQIRTVPLESYTPKSRAHECTRAYTCEYLVIAANMSERANFSCESDCLHSEMARRRNEVLIQWMEGSCKCEVNRALHLLLAWCLVSRRPTLFLPPVLQADVSLYNEGKIGLVRETTSCSWTLPSHSLPQKAAPTCSDLPIQRRSSSRRFDAADSLVVTMSSFTSSLTTCAGVLPQSY